MSLYPENVRTNDILFVNVTVPSCLGISSIVADMGGLETIVLSLLVNNSYVKLWQAAWVVPDVDSGGYVATITLMNDTNDSFVLEKTWSILPDDIIENSNYSNGVTNETNNQVNQSSNQSVKAESYGEVPTNNSVVNSFESAISNASSSDIVPVNSSEYNRSMDSNETKSFFTNISSPAPTITETPIDSLHKRVTVASNIHYTNVTAFTTIDNRPNSTVHLYHIINGSRMEIDFTGFDLDNDSLVDRIEWTVPHLSEQTYEIVIEITKAEHLDKNRIFLADISDDVKAKDGRWSEPICNGEYVRVTFESPLEKDNDITIVARSSGVSRIEVYAKDSESLITTFENITGEHRYQIFLTNLSDSQTTFDLRTSGDVIEYEYIVDPTTGWVSPTGNADPSGQWTTETRVYDDNTGTYATHTGAVGWRGFLELTLSSSIYCNRVRVFSDFGGAVDLVDVDIYNSTSWIDKYNGTIANDAWAELSFSAETNVTKARFRYHYTANGWNYWLYEFDFWQGQSLTSPNGTTLNATSIDETSAILNGNVSDDGGEPCEYRFQYGSDTSYGNNTTWGGSEVKNSNFGTMIYNLTLGHTYQYRVQVRNSNGTVNGSNKNFTTATPSLGWVTPTNHNDPNSQWENENKIYDDDTDSYARSYHDANDPDGQWSFYVSVNHSVLLCDKIRFYAKGPTGDTVQIDQVDLDVKKGGVWVDIYQGAFSDRQWVEKSFTQGSVTEGRIRFHVNVNNGGMYYELYEFDFNKSRPVPTITNEGPTNRSYGIALRPQMNITVNNPDGNSMTISWSSNSSGSWQLFGINSSVGNGTYHQRNNNFSSNNTKYWWKVSVTDGTDINTSWYSFSTPDLIKPSSNVVAITPYWKKTSPITITAIASDTGWSGLKNVTLYYRFSSNNASWGGWKSAGVDTTSPWSWSFAFSNGTGCYQFYSIAKDNATNAEAAPGSADALCGYDNVAPTSSVTAIVPYWKNLATTVTATATDGLSGVKNATLYYRFSSNNASWGGWMSGGVDTASPWSWSFAFSNGSGYYQIYSIAKDNATNAEAAPGGADAWCGYDTTASSSSVNAIAAPYWKTTSPLVITVTASDTGPSGLKNVTLYYYNSTNNASWRGPWKFGNTNSTPWITPIRWNFNLPNGTGYYRFYSGSADNATNMETAPAVNDTKCGYDTTSSSSSVDGISPYWKKAAITITATASDVTSGVKNVTLWYRFSNNNVSWGRWVSAGVDIASPWSWSFSFSNGTGYYQFYSIAEDNASNAESAPGSADTGCGYDTQSPSSLVNVISEYWHASSSLNVTATVSDNGPSGLKNVTLYYRYRVSNASGWGGYVSFGVDANPWVACRWSFTFPNWTGHYQFYSIATDNVTNVEAAPGSADAWCGYDSVLPSSSVDAVTPYWKKAATTITALVSDAISGVKNVTLYYRFSNNNASWGGWVSGGVDSASPWSWSFVSSNGSGYYQFYSIARDNATNVEAAPGSADAWCGYDVTAPNSSVDAVTPYWKKAATTITVSVSDATSGVKNVTLYYQFSSNNISWDGWVSAGVDTASPWSWTFVFSNGSGYYQYYSIAKDNATNAEAAPGSADAKSGYDDQGPSSSVDAISGYWITSSPLIITATASDTEPSGLKNIILYYRYRATNASSWGGWVNSGLVDSDPWVAISWSFNFPNGTGHYQFYTIATDNATNIETAPDGNGDESCGFNNGAPLSSINAITPYWTSSTPLALTATAEDYGPSGLKNVTLYYYNSPDNITWSGPWYFGIDNEPWVGCSWSFTFPNQTGYYRFYSCAADNSSNIENAPVINDTGCGYDYQAPTCTIMYNRSATYFKANDSLRIYANFTEPYSGINESSVLIAISTLGDGNRNNTSMSMIDNLHWYYVWTIPSGSDDDGPFTINVYANDNAFNNLDPHPTADNSKQIDNTAPGISSISVRNISSSSVVINWITNENATSHITYGTTLSYGLWSNHSEFVTSHSYLLTGLSSNSNYHYKVISYDQAGNQNMSSDNTFTTSSEPQPSVSKLAIHSVIQNTPPSNPTIDGPTAGHRNINYNYTVRSIDTNNDTIQYTFNWGDGITESSGFLPSGINCIKNHSWTIAGKYTIKVTASDNRTSSSSEKSVWIDSIAISDLGYLLDSDGDGIFDSFHNDATGKETLTEMRNGIYLIDLDGNQRWDYEYNSTSGMITLINQQPSMTEEKPQFLLLWLGGLIFAVVVVLAIILYRKRPLKDNATEKR